jgi:multidrug efflux pump subunit AcrB
MTSGASIPAPRSFTTRLVATFLEGHFSLLLILISLGLGAVALLVTAREEDPQIEVPFVDVHLELPLATPAEALRQGVEPIEGLLSGLPGVEHVYSIARQGGALVSVRFHVGHNREQALVDVNARLAAAQGQLPAAVSQLRVEPIEIDAVPILVLTLHATLERAEELRAVAEELASDLGSVKDVSKVTIVGGHGRVLRVLLDPERLAASGITPAAIEERLQAALGGRRVGEFLSASQNLPVEVGSPLSSAADLSRLPISGAGEAPLCLSDVAQLIEGAPLPDAYHLLSFGPSAPLAPTGQALSDAELNGPPRAAISLALSKRRGSNAVQVAAAALERMQALAPEHLTAGLGWRVTRNAGATAQEKVHELIGHLLLAIGTIALLVGGSLGWRAALVVALAVPLTLALTLFADLLVGYTINRVTLFALILALGLLVDDPIVDVENIHRHLERGDQDPKSATLTAVDEVRPPVILATLAVIGSFLPMFFVGGMMGPYMRPMPFNVPMAMAVSLLVAFTVTPWAALHLLKPKRHSAHSPSEPSGHREGRLLRAYRRLATGLLATRARQRGLLWITAALFVLSLGLVGLGAVPLKMLPYDNKSELSLVLDAPEGTSLERTQACVDELVASLRQRPEVSDIASYAGAPSPHDFNGLVRHHFLRHGSHLADVRVLFAPRHERSIKAHSLTLALRPGLAAIAERHGFELKLVEPPPGPPVLAGLVAELYGPTQASDDQWAAATRALEQRLASVPGIVEVDSFLDATSPKLSVAVDHSAAASRGVSVAGVAAGLELCLNGRTIGALQRENSAAPIPVRLEWPVARRSTTTDLETLPLSGSNGPVPLSAVASVIPGINAPARYRKDQQRVMYVTAEPAGLTPVNAVLALNRALAKEPLPAGFRIELAGEGEWQVTVDVFRDLGLAFAAALVLIFVLLVFETKSFALSGLMMLAIPLTLVGVFPGFALLNWFFSGQVGAYPDPIYFTATAMIGVIALAGIVVRNSILLIDFMETGRHRGQPALSAAIDASALRLRPILLTAGAAVLGAWVIVFDPIFSGLAWAFIFGIAASTAFSLVVVPAAYVLLRGQAHPTPPPAQSVGA